MTTLDIPAYLARIHDRGPLEPTAETLRRLHLAHLFTVPFENLSIHWGEPIELRDEALFDKVVSRRRGGFCYELNGLFAALLRSLGFEVAMLSAQVFGAAGVFGREGDHMALLVTLGERWLVDVGFGESFREPLRLDERGEQSEGRHGYRIEEAAEARRVLSRREEGGTWKAEYRFRLAPHVYADFAEMCHFHQTSPDSHFTQNRICSLATPDGRLSLSGRRLITTRGGEKQELELADESEVAEVLRERFGVVRATLPFPPAPRRPHRGRG
ncbi:MAG TPA: arylamine N-acetyltransferase [Thermoanaerobaculia bacterium]